MAYTLPNNADAAVAAIAAPDSVDFAVITSGMARTGVESGLVATVSGSTMTAVLTAGKVWINNSAYSIAAGTATITTAHATLARFDLITAGTAGTIAVVTGTAAANPVFPAVPSTSVALYAVYVGGGVTVIAANRVVDKRVILADPSDYLAYGFF